jgi:hypothetical protein
LTIFIAKKRKADGSQMFPRDLASMGHTDQTVIANHTDRE